MSYIDPSIKTLTANTSSVNSTAKTGTNNKEFCLDDVLLRLLSGDISALTELKANNISYIKKGSDGDFIITFLYEQEKYEVHCFVNPDTKLPYVDIKKSFNKARDAAGIKNFRFHDLRHTVATRLVEKGIDLLVVMEILGHTKIETTMRYAHPTPKRKSDAINVLNLYN